MLDWKPNDQCRVVYTLDGLEYDAVIDSIDGEDDGRYAILHFVDYPETFQVQ